MTLKSKLSLTAILLSSALYVGTLSYCTTSFFLSRYNIQEEHTTRNKRSENKYFDIDEEMFDFTKRTQDEFYINPLWYFHYARRQTSTIKS